MNGEKKSIVGVKLANHKIITVFSGEENAGHAVFTTVADNQKKAIFSFYRMDNGTNDWQPAGSMTLNGIPPAPAGEPDFDMYITVNDSGDIVSRIGNPVSGVYKSFQINREKSMHRVTGHALTGSALTGSARRKEEQEKEETRPFSYYGYSNTYNERFYYCRISPFSQVEGPGFGQNAYRKDRS